MKTEQSYHTKPEGNACVPADTLWDYLEGKLSPAQQHQVESHLLDCPLCSDALEGFQLSGGRAKVAQLNVEVAHRITHRSTWYFNAAAATIVMVASLGLLWWALGDKTADKIALNPQEERKQEKISAASPAEQKGPGSPEPALNRPAASDALVPMAQAPAAGNTVIAKDQSFSMAQEPTFAWSTELQNNKVAAEGEETTPSSNLAEVEYDKQTDITSSGAGAGPSPGTAPVTITPSSPKPAAAPPVASQRSSAMDEYSNAPNNKSAKSKQAPSAGATNKKKASLAEGMYYYNAANFPEAIKIFKDILKEDETNQEARYYLGMSYNNNGDKTKALEELTKVTSTCVYYDSALWERSLLLIEAGRKEEAKPLLQKLVDGMGKYSQMAMNKLNEL